MSTLGIILAFVAMGFVLLAFLIARSIGAIINVQTEKAKALEETIRSHAEFIRQGRAYAFDDSDLTPEEKAQGLLLGELDPHCPDCGSARCLKGQNMRDYCHVPEHLDEIMLNEDMGIDPCNPFALRKRQSMKPKPRHGEKVCPSCKTFTIPKEWAQCQVCDREVEAEEARARASLTPKPLVGRPPNMS